MKLWHIIKLLDGPKKQGRTKRTGEKILYFCFPNPANEKQRTQRWLHTIGT